MKKQSFIFSLLLALLLVLPVQAQVERAGFDRASLTFNGTTASCTVRITANSNENISATIKLLNGSRCIETWQESATGSLSFHETVSVTKGQSYTLTVSYSVAGKTQPSLSSSGTC